MDDVGLAEVARSEPVGTLPRTLAGLADVGARWCFGVAYPAEAAGDNQREQSCSG